MEKIIDRKHWISSHTVSRYFDIKGNELRKLRKRLKKTDYIRQAKTMMWYFDYNYLITKYTPIEPVWNDLIFNTDFIPWRLKH